MLRVGDVSFSYGAAPVLAGVSFVVPARRIVGLLGPNGSGKTTLLRLMAGTLAAQDGHVQIDGADIRTLSRREIATRIAWCRRRRIARSISPCSTSC